MKDQNSAAHGTHSAEQLKFANGMYNRVLVTPWNYKRAGMVPYTTTFRYHRLRRKVNGATFGKCNWHRFGDETAVLGCRVRIRTRSEGYIVKYTVRYVMSRQSACKICANVCCTDFTSSVHRYHIRHTVLVYAS